MLDQPNATAQTNDFEFEALGEAANYRQALFDEFGRFLRGDVVEVGAGIGQMTEHLVRMPGVNHVVSIEPEAAYCVQHRKRLPGLHLVEGTAADLEPGSDWDAILSINVLEHIREDEQELSRYAQLLGARRGALCLFVPARPEIYAPIDKDFGHFRRYTKPELRKKLVAAGFALERLNYFNSVGYFAWWVNFCLLKKRGFERAKVRFFDRACFPIVHALESKLLRPPFGQSLIAVARSLGGKGRVNWIFDRHLGRADGTGTGNWKVPLTRRQECLRYAVAQTFLSAGSGDFPVDFPVPSLK